MHAERGRFLPRSHLREEDSIIWNTSYAVSTNGSAHAGTMNRLTVGQSSLAGINDWNGGGNFSVTNSLSWTIGGSNFSAVGHSNNACFNPRAAVRHRSIRQYRD
jgi:hypothetical protein